ncbi:hypothetical protein, partial [Acinetobacter baumannii]|uniref:hypothetical protein n=1 Tax=Acinetobacter baumannii TaxID=470 RepID=UPI001896BBFF
TKFPNAYLQGAAFGAAAAIQGVSLSNAAIAVAAGSWSFTEQDGTPFTYCFGPTGLGLIATSASAGVICPSSEFGPCTAGKLTPIDNGPFPAKPTCVAVPPTYSNCTKPSAPS